MNPLTHPIASLTNQAPTSTTTSTDPLSAAGSTISHVGDNHQPHEPQNETMKTTTSTTATTTPANTIPTSESDVCQQIRQSLWWLFDIDDRESWQLDLAVHLLEQGNADNAYDAYGDRRLEGLIAGLNLFIRFFEVRSDYSFRHCRHRFDQAGFLCLSGDPWSYTDDWWDSVSEKSTLLAQNMLVASGLLEFRELDTKLIGSHFRYISFMRLRADRIVAMLQQHDPGKYSNLQMQ